MDFAKADLPTASSTCITDLVQLSSQHHSSLTKNICGATGVTKTSEKFHFTDITVKTGLWSVATTKLDAKDLF